MSLSQFLQKMIWVTMCFFAAYSYYNRNHSNQQNTNTRLLISNLWAMLGIVVAVFF